MHPRSSILLFCLSLVACNKTPPEPESTKVSQPAQGEAPAEPASKPPSTAANPHAANPHAASPHGSTAPVAARGDSKLGIEWKDPEGWTRQPNTSAMRKATLAIPPAKGDKEAGELAVFYFGEQMGGDVEQNIQRWIDQFSNVAEGTTKRSERKAGALQQYVVEIEAGTYSGSMMGGPSKPDYGMLGAVVVAPTGKYFFKLTGPKATVASAREGFDALLASMKPASP